jgi:hypothetical protein
MRAKSIDRGGCCQHVLALEQTRDLGPTNGERPQHQRAMRDRFIARDTGFAGERYAGPRCGQRCELLERDVVGHNEGSVSGGSVVVASPSAYMPVLGGPTAV